MDQMVNQVVRAKPLILSTASRLTQPSHISSAAREAGYTLVELMSVMVIIGLMTSAVVWAIPKSPVSSTDYADMIVREVNAAAQASLLTGKTTALGLSEDAYAIYAYEGEEWQARHTANWPEGVFVSLKKESAELKLTDEVIPLVMFEPTGQSTLFSLTLSSRGRDIRLSSAGDGRVVMETVQ